MGLTPRRLAAISVLLGALAVAVAMGALFSPPVALLVLGVGAIVLGLEELLR
jgi:hypothetical protein